MYHFSHTTSLSKYLKKQQQKMIHFFPLATKTKSVIKPFSLLFSLFGQWAHVKYKIFLHQEQSSKVCSTSPNLPHLYHALSPRWHALSSVIGIPLQVDIKVGSGQCNIRSPA
ncbi:hypothetical protein CEXT_176251 [Caerostris extrusa]|uniref:Uncharacterized protein n=1 Tax=Caerostris extrusa TaxID=172846 RepID=A0AAV4NQF7_CAEEX|nr:hypothetical protein CEXT_176251 [Caerostris extrusa]